MCFAADELATAAANTSVMFVNNSAWDIATRGLRRRSPSSPRRTGAGASCDCYVQVACPHQEFSDFVDNTICATELHHYSLLHTTGMEEDEADR